ncbi:TPA: hypothetical protein ACH3X3_004031 [Trebouxia sp. C0006]
MSALLWAVGLAALIIAGIITGALQLLHQGNAVITAEVRRLGSELQRQAKIVDQLNDSSHGGSCSAKLLQQLQQELQRLDLQSSELKTQVQAESQAQQLLKRLSGVIRELRTQLQVSVQGSAQLQQHSEDIITLRAQLKTRSNDRLELTRQAGVVEELRTHLGMSAERQREMTRQASILDDLKAQLSVSNDLNLELMYRRSSLDEARALMTQALKAQQGADSPGSSTMSFTRMRPPDRQGSMLSPFASQLYQMPKDLQVQLECDSVGFAGVDQPRRRKHQDKGASTAADTQHASDSEVSLGGLPICRSLTRRKSMPGRPQAPSCTPPHSRGGSASSNTAAAAAAAMSFNHHGQRSRRQSRLIKLSAVPTTQTGMRPFAQEFLRQEGSRSDGRSDGRSNGKVALPFTSDHTTVPAAAAAEMKAQKSSEKLSRAVSGAIGLLSPYTRKKHKV